MSHPCTIYVLSSVFMGVPRLLAHGWYMDHTWLARGTYPVLNNSLTFLLLFAPLLWGKIALNDRPHEA